MKYHYFFVGSDAMSGVVTVYSLNGTPKQIYVQICYSFWNWAGSVKFFVCYLLAFNI